ncbi:uncharacterized protein [Diadema setosum]|uniref:uncharacterized protein n=1 Tax=Diadema setosum TaxID=31175 RepID=UPI003B3BDDA6
MNEETRVSKCITKKLERYLNRERVERRFDTSGQGLYRTHPLVVKLELAYLIANEDQKKCEQEACQGKGDGDGGSGLQHSGRRRRRGRSSEDQALTPRIQRLPQKKTRIQMSEISRLTQSAHTTLKSIDADKISTVYRFRQQMVPYDVRHQGKVKQVSTNVHAFLNAEEAWRYRRENDEREKVRKFREQQKAKARAQAAKEMREQELAKLPLGVRLEIMNQREKPRTMALLERVLEDGEKKQDTSPPAATSRDNPAPLADAGKILDGSEQDRNPEDEYEDDFDEEEEEEEEEDNDGSEQLKKEVEEQISEQEHNVHGDTKKLQESETEDDALIAAVTSANDAHSISSFPASTYTLASSAASPASPDAAGGNHGNTTNNDEGSTVYEDDSFESDSEEEGELAFSKVDTRSSSVTPSENASRPLSRMQSARTESAGDVASNPNQEDDVAISTSSLNSHGDGVKGEDASVDQSTDSAKVTTLAHQLARTAVKSAAHEEDATYSTTSSISVRTADRQAQPPGQDRRKDSTQEYVRTESVLSLSDRVRRDTEAD